MAKGHIKHILSALLIAAFSFGSTFISTIPAYAEGDNRPAIFLQVSPPSVQLGELEPGEQKTGKFLVQNIGAGEFEYKIYATPYQVSGENYEPLYDSKNNYTQITNWITFSRTKGTLAPGTDQEITFTVNVPEDAPGGGQYASIMVETDSGNNKNATVKTTSRVGMIVYSHVNGETRECGKILKQTISGFLIEPPIAASSLIENCGNVDLNATYTFQVFPLLSNEEIFSNEERPEVSITLPETKRYNNITWDESPSFGIFRVKQTIIFADKTESSEKLVIICPLWLVIIIIAFIGSVVFWIVSRNRARKEAKSGKSGE